MGIAVVMDATVVRALLVPATMRCSAAGTGGPPPPSNASTAASAYPEATRIRTEPPGVAWRSSLSRAPPTRQAIPLARDGRREGSDARRRGGTPRVAPTPRAARRPTSRLSLIGGRAAHYFSRKRFRSEAPIPSKRARRDLDANRPLAPLVLRAIDHRATRRTVSGSKPLAMMSCRPCSPRRSLEDGVELG